MNFVRMIERRMFSSLISVVIGIGYFFVLRECHEINMHVEDTFDRVYFVFLPFLVVLILCKFYFADFWLGEIFCVTISQKSISKLITSCFARPNEYDDGDANGLNVLMSCGCDENEQCKCFDVVRFTVHSELLPYSNRSLSWSSSHSMRGQHAGYISLPSPGISRQFLPIASSDAHLEIRKKDFCQLINRSVHIWSHN